MNHYHVIRQSGEIVEEAPLNSRHLSSLKIYYFFNTNLLLLEGFPKILTNFLPLILMAIGGIGSDQLKDKYR